jgi:hypothetical protein
MEFLERTQYQTYTFDVVDEGERFTINQVLKLPS